MKPPEHFQNCHPLSTAGDASLFRSGSGEGLSELLMEFPAVLRVSLIVARQWDPQDFPGEQKKHIKKTHMKNFTEGVGQGVREGGFGARILYAGVSFPS